MAADFQLLCGDVVERLRELPDESIDAVVTDPPYELGFMGKKWDASGIAYRVELWQQVLRVLKPGGHLLAFGGTRTYHRMACAIEDAGFEIRDSMHWIYGSGFPKSLDVSKAIDGVLGATDKRPVIGEWNMPGRGSRSPEQKYGLARDSGKITDAATAAAAAEWRGWGTALKPAHEPIILARKPLIDTVAANVLEHGTGAINIDGCRLPSTGEELGRASGGWQKGGYVGGVAQKYDSVGNVPAGRWPANVLLSEEAAADLDASVGTNHGGAAPASGPTRTGEFQSRAMSGKFNGTDEPPKFYGDKGGASRFFYVAKSSRSEREAGCEHLPQKSAGEATDRKDGSAGLNSPRAGAGRTSGARNHHPTVKPIDLMRHLVRLVTPPGGIVLDPFTGSGTTGIAAILEGFDFLGFERESDYLTIAEARLKHWSEKEKAV